MVTDSQTNTETHKQTGPITIHCATASLVHSVKNVIWKVQHRLISQYLQLQGILGIRQSSVECIIHSDHPHRGKQCACLVAVIMPRPHRVEALGDDTRLMSVCLSRTSGPSREQRRLEILKLTQVAHITRDLDTTFKVKRSKVNLRGRGMWWQPPTQIVFLGGVLTITRVRWETIYAFGSYEHQDIVCRTL